MAINPLLIIQALQTVNGLIIEGQKLAVTLNGKELTNEELEAKIDLAILAIEFNRDND